MTRARPEPQFRTPRELAAMFRVSVATIARWRRQGKLPGRLTPGGRYLYAAADIQALLKDEDDE
jgi:predicted site-specific integrase-resolvase